MKIDKRKPSHWLLLLGFFVQSVLGLLRRMSHRQTGGTVILYGHKLNGNLLALQDYMRANPSSGLQPIFLTMDAGYRRELQAQGIKCEWAAGMGCSRLLREAVALVSDHGLHALQPLLGAYQRMGLRFIDVWHGIPFKGFDADDFRLQHRYDEIWVASDLCRDMYVERFGFDPERVRAMGYARTDRLAARLEDNAAMREGLGIARERKTILFAPTWAQDARGRSIYPFGCDERGFVGALSAFASAQCAIILLRSHLNTGIGLEAAYPNVVALPSSRYPDAEAILLASDVLVCDWSSIAFDYLLLDRPTIFLDVTPPFAKGFSLGPEYRFGSVVQDLPGMLRMLEVCMATPDAYWQAHTACHRAVKQRVYGDRSDGQAATRCIARLQAMLGGMNS